MKDPHYHLRDWGKLYKIGMDKVIEMNMENNKR